ncbi:MAG TPA: hypothetical protein VJB67_03035 [Patescibacteria group bacterium]|nr:hypothetical protein [Patescibacteria group bacterium]
MKIFFDTGFLSASGGAMLPPVPRNDDPNRHPEGTTGGSDCGDPVGLKWDF